MKTLLLLIAAALLAGCAVPPAASTQGGIALANLDDQLQRQPDDPSSIELWLLRLQFLADYRVLDRVADLTEARADGPAELLRRARARMAAHRFADAQADLDAAAAGPAQRAALLVATGRAVEVLPAL